eukprot:m.181215 g.181215  ORF g.181215 m.181215 type:complete len:291 (-) comp14662_c1_seq17:2667-3539(-)
MATPAQPTQRTPLLPVNGETDALPTSNGAIVGWTPRVHQACPTCNGKGKIPKDAFSRNELVTLISVNDKRLKPRRTKLYLGITLILALSLVGCLVFLLSPRRILISVAGLGNSTSMSVKCAENDPHVIAALNISVSLPLLLDNPNYVSARFRDSRVALTTLYGITVTNQSIELPELGKEATKSTNVQALVQLHRDAAHIYNTSCARASTLPYNQFALLLHLNATAHVGAARKVPISMSSVIQVLCTIPSSPIGPPSNSTTTTTAVPATSQTAQFEFSTFPVSDIPPCLRP